MPERSRLFPRYGAICEPSIYQQYYLALIATARVPVGSKPPGTSSCVRLDTKSRRKVLNRPFGRTIFPNKNEVFIDSH
jgi:hypothetical protein